MNNWAASRYNWNDPDYTCKSFIFERWLFLQLFPSIVRDIMDSKQNYNIKILTNQWCSLRKTNLNNIQDHSLKKNTDMTLSTLLILAAERTLVIYELRNGPCSPQPASLWLSGRASERGILRSKGRFLMRTLNFFFVPLSWRDEKNRYLWDIKIWRKMFFRLVTSEGQRNNSESPC